MQEPSYGTRSNKKIKSCIWNNHRKTSKRKHSEVHKRCMTRTTENEEKPLIWKDEVVQEKIRQEYEEEEDIFFGQDNPNHDECA